MVMQKATFNLPINTDIENLCLSLVESLETNFDSISYPPSGKSVENNQSDFTNSIKQLHRLNISPKLEDEFERYSRKSSKSLRLFKGALPIDDWDQTLKSPKSPVKFVSENELENQQFLERNTTTTATYYPHLRITSKELESVKLKPVPKSISKTNSEKDFTLNQEIVFSSPGTVSLK